MNKVNCPYCGNNDLDAEYVDNGLGMVQISPHICWECGAVEIGPYDKQEYTIAERDVGFYKPPEDFAKAKEQS